MSKKDTFYFSHDYNARNDSKIKKLMSKHGMAGYGLFWAIVEDLYNNANALPLDYESIAFDLRTDTDIIKSVINDYDLFVINDGEFGSMSVQKRLNERIAKSTKARESAYNRWNKCERNANAEQTQSDSNAIKEKKVKDIKLKDNIDYQLCVDFWLKEFHVDFSFNATSGKKLKSIITKIKKLMNDGNKPITDESILQSFRYICHKLPEWYKDKDLAVIDSKFNEIIAEIKNGTSKIDKSRNAAEDAVRILTGEQLR